MDEQAVTGSAGLPEEGGADLVGGLRFDEDLPGMRPSGVQPGVVRYYPAPAGSGRPARRSGWWHLLGAVVGVLGAAAIALLWSYGLRELADPAARSDLTGGAHLRGLAATAGVGVLAALVVAARRLSALAPLLAGVGCAAATAADVLKPGAVWRMLPGYLRPGASALELAALLAVPAGLFLVTACTARR